MGLESANYSFVPRADAATRVLEVLANIGACEKRPEELSKFRYFVLSGSDHWIDFQWNFEFTEKLASLSIRVALCNPDKVENRLKEIIQILLVDCGGEILDKDSKKSYHSIESSSDWSQLWNDYVNRRTAFRKWFGDYVAPISGDVVFEFARNVKPKAP